MNIYIYIYTREISAFGGTSLALRESGAFGGGKSVLSFEIGLRESGFYSERTDRITDRQSDRTIQYRISI